MKRKILFLTAALGLFALVGCEGITTEGMTRITYYAELNVEGDSTFWIDKGTTYVEPGYSAIMQGEDVTDDVEVTSNVNTDRPGIYSVNYKITNADGFFSSTTRKVIVTDPNSPIDGYWSTDPSSFRVDSRDGATVDYGASFDILVIDHGDGTWYIEDLYGGYYCQRADYGTAYNMGGELRVAADGTVTLISSDIVPWGDTATGLANGSFDAATGVLSYGLGYTANYIFNVKMSKKSE